MSFTTKLPERVRRGLRAVSPDIDYEVVWEYERYPNCYPEDAYSEEDLAGLACFNVSVRVIIDQEDDDSWFGLGHLGSVWAYENDPDPEVQGYLLQMLLDALNQIDSAVYWEQVAAARDFLEGLAEEEARKARLERIHKDVMSGRKTPTKKGSGSRFRDLELGLPEDAPVVPRPASKRFKGLLDNPRKRRKR